MTRSLSRNLKRLVAGLCAVLIVSGTVPVQPIAEHINEYTAITASAVTTTYTKDSEGIADGVILKPGDSIDTSGTSQNLEFDSKTAVDYLGDGSDVFDADSGEEWWEVTGFKLDENGKFYCANCGNDSLLTPGELKSFKVSYDSANDMWHIGQVGFSLIDSSDAIKGKDLPEIAPDDAKAWVKAHIDEIKAADPEFDGHYTFTFKYNGSYYFAPVHFVAFNDNDFENFWDTVLDSFGSEEEIIGQVNSVLSNKDKAFLWQGESSSQTEEQNAPVSYLKWDDTEKKLVEHTGDAACKEYTEVTAETTAFEDGKWYVVNADTTISSRITVTGTANLILADGKTLTASKGIEVATGNTLNIYAQSEGDTAGILFANANDYDAGIGGGAYGAGGTVTVNGGNITATGGTSAAGIGGGPIGAGGTVTVNGGTVTANGGNEAAGIGSGNNFQSGSDRSGGTVTINGGTVTATGGAYAAGIGGGDTSRGATVTINGGTVTATGRNQDGYITPGIGAGADINDNGSLTVADTLGVFGGESADPTDIQTDYASTRWLYMIVGVPHSHDFSYSADGATITATCNGMGVGGCDITEGLTMTISASDAAYDGTAHGATLSTGYNTTAFPGTYTIEYFKGETKLDGAPVDAGNYTAKVTVGDATASVDFTIAKKSVTVTAEAKSKTYGKDDPELTYTAEGLVGSDTLSGALTRAAGENVGTYDITQGTLTAGDNYDINFSGAKFKINKAEITITADDKSTQYKSDIAPLTYQVSGDYVEGDELNIELSTTATNTSPIGEYDIVASYNNDNYDATLVKGKYTITKADLTTSATGYSGKYDGEAHSISVDVGDSDAVVYYGTEELTAENYKTAGSTTNPAYTDAGEYTVYYYIATGNYDPQPVSGSKVVKIDKADPTVTQPTAKELTANGEAQELVNAGSTENGKIVYALGEKGTAPAEDAYSETVPTGKDAGTYYVWYKVLGDGNHNDTEPACVEVKIAEPETQPENKLDGDTPAKTGAAAAGFGAVTLAAAAVIVSKKRKK